MQNTMATYSFVDDIELYPASLMEMTMPDGMLGPVNNCLIAKHFYTLKVTDRFYYENGNQPGSFTTGRPNKSNLITLHVSNCAVSICAYYQPLKHQCPLLAAQLDEIRKSSK